MNRKGDGFFQAVSLDVDEKIFDRNLKIVNDTADDEFSSLFPGMGSTPDQIRPKGHDLVSLLPEKDYPSVQVTPDPGICVKTKNISDEKVFINLCKIQEIPPAPPITEEKLQEIIMNEDYTADYKVPMSLGAPRKETDKSGQTCYACDVAINSIWYTDTMINSLTFTTFVINLAMEGLCDKYGDVVNLDRQNWTILKNKKYQGSLQRHHIQQRPGLTKIQELHGPTSLDRPSPTQHKIIEISETPKPQMVKIKPEFTLHKSPGKNELIAKIMVPRAKSGRQMMLDIGEDRLVFESRENNYFLDIFLPIKLNGVKAVAEFNIQLKTVTIRVPIIQ